MADRLVRYWVYGGFLAGLLLLALLPLLTAGWSTVETLTFAVLPAYMLHQYEEHDDDRFRRFVNAKLAGGRDALTPRAVFVINIVGVWAVLAAVIWITRDVAQGFATVAAWIILVNAALHIAQGFALKCYNPGLATAVVLFVPLGLVLLRTALPVASLGQTLAGLGFAIALHAAIVLHVRRRIEAA
ncbi:MAG: HXXEE domain-containing protein [Hyphomicrobiales bacterium]